MAERPRVLLIDDDQRVLSAMERVLSPDFEVWKCLNGRLGLETLDQMGQLNCLPSLVVTDYNMPEKNGIEVCEGTRQNYPDIPVILITSERGMDSIKKTSPACDDIPTFTKPINPREFIDQLHQSLEKAYPKGIPKERMGDDLPFTKGMGLG